MAINEVDHEKSLSDPSNIIPKSVISMENFYDLQYKFRQTINCKTQSSTLNHTPVNLGIEHEPRFINLGIHCSHDERKSFIKLYREYKDFFDWTYDELRTFETTIMNHNIPMKPDVKLYQHK